MDNQVYMLLFGGVPKKPNGLIASVIRRSEAFSHHGIANEILAYVPHFDFDENVARFRRIGAMSPETRVRFMYNELGGEPEQAPPVIEHPVEEDGWAVLRDAKDGKIFRCYKDGLYLRYKAYTDTGRLWFVDFLSPNGVRDRREVYDPEGYVRRVEYMDPATNKPARVVFRNRAGRAYLSVAKSKVDGATTGMVLFGQDGQIIRELATENDLLSYWLNDVVFKNSRDKVILISEYGFTRSTLQRLEAQRENLRVIYTFHNNHFAHPHEPGSPLKKEHVDFFAHLGQVRGTVFLTEQQRREVIDEYGCESKVFAVPHHAPRVSNTRGIARDPMRVVMMARYDKVSKHPDDAIRAFREVIKKVPEARLELYGHGPDEDYLRGLVAQLNVASNVRVAGVTDDPNGVFFGAAMSLMPSEYEGHPLALMESMTAGCVPVIYDFRYGAKDFVRSGENGIVVPKGDVNALASAIISLLQNPALCAKLSREAAKIVDVLTEEKLVSDWRKVFAAVS